MKSLLEKCPDLVAQNNGDGSSGPECLIPSIVPYDHQRSRAGQCAVDFLEGYNQ
jgi:hypothetical protein